MRGKILFLVLVLNIFIVNAGDVAYILKNTRAPNYDFMYAFEDLNLSVDLIRANKIKEINYNSYKLIFVGNERFYNSKDFLIDQKNSLIANSFHLNEWGLTNDDVSQIASNSQLKVKKGNKILTVYDRCCFSNNIGLPMYYLFSLNKDNDVKNIASTLINNEDSVVGFIKKGSNLSNGKINKGRLVFFGITESNFWTNEARKLFKEAIISAIENLDKDNDGFNEDLDCDDNNKDVNPSIVEIPNNNIDENCDGQDLVIDTPNKNQTLPTEIDVSLIRNRNNQLIKNEKFYFKPNTNFNKPEDFLINYKLDSNLETGFYDIILLGKSMNDMCILNNDLTKLKFTILITGENK